ncbi:MAG: DNA polymerase II [Candidatus Pacearchaeota archaeon]|nr:DNA polymerase II [Candidatus Pacearchaeota archaeon]
MKPQKAFIVSISHINMHDKTYIQLFGRLENGKSFCSLHEFTPYFFIKKSDLQEIKNLISGKLKDFKTEETNLANFNNEKVIKISSKNKSEIDKLAKAIHKKNIETYEADLNPGARFLIDYNLSGFLEISGNTFDSGEIQRTDFLFKNPEINAINPEEIKINLKVLSIDIESGKKSNDLFCVGLYSKNYEKNFLISEKKENIKDTISCKNEAELLSKLKEEIINFDPDIITGWHVIDFDLAYLKQKFEEHRISFDIGRTNQAGRIKIENNFFKNSSANIPGRQVLDGLNLIKDQFIKEAPSIKNRKFENYTLEAVSQEILGDGKLIKGKQRHEEIEKLFKTNKKKLVEYNIQDCKLAYDILEKTKIIELAIERTSLTGLPLNKLTASIAAFDSLYIREARSRGFVSPTTKFSQREERIKGGFVMSPIPGIYHNVLVLDFKSLYPSIIKTFNIDPSSFIEEPTSKKDLIESPNKAYFKNQTGILPEIIEKLHQAREKAKKESRELSSYAIKIIMNSFFGVLASPNCRYYNLKIANAITHFGQELIQLTAKEIEKNFNTPVIYSDTDSVFVDTNLGKIKANIIGLEIQNKINNFYKKYVKEKYDRKSFLELEFEKQYLSLLMPKIRGEGKEGSKKRYAGLIEKNGKEEIQITGLEAIRGDWTDAAKEFQIRLLTKIFHKEDPIKFIKEYVKKIESGEMDEKLIYRKSIRKSLEKYTKTTPPHVKAARLLPKIESNTIEYYITIKGPEPIQNLKHKIDYKHYIDKQIKPIANTILFFFNKDFEEIIQNSKQMKLF